MDDQLLHCFLYLCRWEWPGIEITDYLFWQCTFIRHRSGDLWWRFQMTCSDNVPFVLTGGEWPGMEITDYLFWQCTFFFCTGQVDLWWRFQTTCSDNIPFVLTGGNDLLWRLQITCPDGAPFLLCRSGWPVMEIPDNMSWQRPFCPHRWEWCWSPSCLSSRQHLWRHSTTQTALSAWRLRLPWATWSSSMCEWTPCLWSCSQEWRHQMIPASSEWCRWTERGIQPDVHGLGFHTRFRIRVLSFSLIVKVGRMFSPSEELQQHVWPHENQVTETAFHVEQRLIELNPITDD